MGTPRIALSACLFLPLAAAPAPHADPDPEVLLRALSEGRASAAAVSLEDPEMRRVLAADTRALYRICFQASESHRALFRESPQKAAGVASLLETVATEAAADPEDRDAAAARLYALLVDARIARAAGRSVGPDRWYEIASGLEGMVTGPDGAREPSAAPTLVRAAMVRSEGAAAAGKAGGPAWEAAMALADAANALVPGDPAVALARVRLSLDHLRWLGEHRLGGGEARLESLLLRLALARNGREQDLDLVTAYNDAVTLARVLRIRKAGLEYESESVIPCRRFELRVPLGRRWSAPDSGPGSTHQIDASGEKVRELEVRAFDWDLKYTPVAGREVKGDSLRDLAADCLEAARAGLAKSKVTRPLFQGRLSSFPMGLTFALEGTTAAGEFRERREWIFKSGQGNQITFAVALVSFRKDMEEDPEFRFVLESLKEK